MASEAQKIFIGLTEWMDNDLALAQAGDLEECVGEDGEVDVEKVAGIANSLVIRKPYLKRPQGSPETPVTGGPTGLAVGSGRRVQRTGVDESALRRKYKLDAY